MSELHLEAETPIAIIHPNGTRIEFNAAGAVIVSGNIAVKVTRPADENIGKVMEGGMIYAGVSPDTNAPIDIDAQDRPRLSYEDILQLEEVKEGTLRLPTTNELSMIYNNKAQLGRFETGLQFPLNFYRAAESVSETDAEGYRFDRGGYKDCEKKDVITPFRLVRDRSLG